VAVVTGASRGIGLAVAERLAADGLAVACTATSGEAAQAVAARIRDEHGVDTVGVAVRVEDAAVVERALSEVEDRLGPVTVMVNNAGVAGVAPFLEVTAEEFARVVEVNLRGVFHGSQAAARRMVDGGRGGVVVNIGSIAGITAFPRRAGYCASKAAVHQLTKVMALDLASHGIRVNCVAPGYIRTDLIADLIAEGKLDEAPLRRRIPLGDLGRGADVAAAVSWLVSDEARYVTGETVVVDGGWLAYGHV
jgi:NAD(P)-dependent dehydrogenase (short-subunit alcohol dehydrogenase family)